MLAAAFATPSAALVFARADIEPTAEVPPDFPYWENVTQRRYGGPSAIYLGGGWAITARHVGHGEIMLHGEPYPPERGYRHTLLNENGSFADAVVFQLKDDLEIPDLPVVPIAREGPRAGEEVLMVGFGRVRREDPEASEATADGPAFFRWSAEGEKRWGTNRVVERDRWIGQERFRTWSFVTRFEAPGDPQTTVHEASAALGDSGGAVFVRRDGDWKLVGLIVSVATERSNEPVRATSFGDLTYSADLSRYRAEILRWTRPECSNEIDDDGDDVMDHPADRDCQGPADDSERPARGDAVVRLEWIGIGLAAGLWVALFYLIQKRKQDADV